METRDVTLPPEVWAAIDAIAELAKTDYNHTMDYNQIIGLFILHVAETQMGEPDIFALDSSKAN